jgi:hypothetical protein
LPIIVESHFANEIRGKSHETEVSFIRDAMGGQGSKKKKGIKPQFMRFTGELFIIFFL